MKATLIVAIIISALLIGGLIGEALLVSAQQRPVGQQTRSFCIQNYNAKNCKRAWDASDKSGFCPPGYRVVFGHCSAISNAPLCPLGGGQSGHECYCYYTCKKIPTTPGTAPNSNNYEVTH